MKKYLFLLFYLFHFPIAGHSQKSIDRFGDFIIGKTTTNIIDSLKEKYPFYNSAYEYGDLEVEYNFRTKKNLKDEKALIQYGNEDTINNQYFIIDRDYGLRTDYSKFTPYTKMAFYHIKNYQLTDELSTKDLILVFRQDTLKQIFFRDFQTESSNTSVSEILSIRYGKPQVKIYSKRSCYDIEYRHFNADDFQFYYWDIGYTIKMYFLYAVQYDAKCESLTYNNGYIYTTKFKNYFDTVTKLIDDFHERIEELEKIRKYQEF
ncbi:MAG: hypothetical protein ABJB05_07640 [Parafilimonas sp.]